MMQKGLLFTLILFLAVACKQKKNDFSGNEPVTVEEFIDFFTLKEVPFAIADTQISKKLSDSFLISKAIINQFIPDSVYLKDYAKGPEPKFYAMGKVQEKDNETYLILKVATIERQAAYLICFDKKNNYKAAMEFIKNKGKSTFSTTGSISNKYVISTNQVNIAKDGQRYYHLNSYIYNTEGVFTLIKKETNEPKVEKEVYNPIDTFSRSNKWAGDYIKDKKNFISVRDGKDEKKIMFFVHFDRGSEDCRGELKGEATFIKPDIAQYKTTGDACVLHLQFKNNTVTLLEEQACGNYRGIMCTFNNSYTKKAPPKSTAKKPAAKKK